MARDTDTEQVLFNADAHPGVRNKRRSTAPNSTGPYTYVVVGVYSPPTSTPFRHTILIFLIATWTLPLCSTIMSKKTRDF